MSWLNFNDSLNNLKGQISSFANNVLADDNKDSNGINSDLEELQRVCSKQQEEINHFRKLNEELSYGGKPISFSDNELATQPDTSWAWEVPTSVSKFDNNKSDEIIANLKETIKKLESEKEELVMNLDLLDSDYQLNTEKIVKMKEKLQSDYNDLEEKYSLLQDDYSKLRENKEKDKRELEDLKLKYQITLQEKSKPVDETSQKSTCTKCEFLLEENRKLISETETLKNDIKVLNSSQNTLQKILEDSKIASDIELKELKEKLKLCESENKILIAELQKTTQSIAVFEKKSEVDAENCKKLALILEGYEQQVSSLKEELLSTKNNSSVEDVDQLKEELKHIQDKLKSTIEEKEKIHKKYVNILTENVKRYVDNGKSCDPFNSHSSESDPQIAEFSHQVESILNILLDLKCKCENLERDLFNVTEEKTKLLSEKNHEIEKLLQNSEILSQEVITKSQTIKDYENECNELIKNNDMLINELEAYKNSSGLQTISESNEDNILLLESQLDSANKKVEELENIISNLESRISDGSTPEETSSQRNEEVINQNLLDQLISENSSLKGEVKRLHENYMLISEEKEKLNHSLEKIKIDLENTEYQYAEININMESLKEEVEIQKKKIENLVEQNVALEKMNIECERTNENIRSEFNSAREKLLFEEDRSKQLENQIRNLTEKLQNAKMCETSLKLQYDTVSKELVGMTEAKCTLETSLKKTLENLTHCQNNVLLLQQENEELKNINSGLEEKNRLNAEPLASELERDKLISGNEESSLITQFESVNLNESNEKLKIDNLAIQTELNELKQQLNISNEEKLSLQDELSKLSEINTQHLDCSNKIAALERLIEDLNKEKNELTSVIITKHQENVTYHNEIQRLSQILTAESEKAHNLEILLEEAKASSSKNTEIENKNEEIEKLTDQNNFLREKCEILAENLLQEQNKVQQILAEHAGPSEKEQILAKKLERLQTHLIEVEEHYTQELLRAEERNTELQAKVNEIELREKNSSTMYTSVSIRANQHVETLQHQLQLITNQRDELRKKISDAEDYASKQEAALANLQFVLEQFQKDKEKDVQQETERIRRQISAEKRVQEDLRKEIASLQSQLEESKQGLQAASRLSDQLEQSKQLIVSLRSEVSQLKEKLSKSEAQLQILSSQHDGKVDKSLIKNLIIGFVSTNNNLTKDQVQIMKIIATVLDFNQQDHDKIGLNKPQQGWLSSLLNPQTSQGMSQESLSQAFVKFLENESKPRLVPSLLSNNEASTSLRKNSTTTGPRQSPSILSEVVLPTFADFAQNRNSSSILKDVLKDNS